MTDDAPPIAGTPTPEPETSDAGAGGGAAAPELRLAASSQVRDPERYQIVGEHGRGGLGRVARAHDRELGRDIAIKELLSPGDVNEARFMREALITARLEHPGIVPVYEAGCWPDGTPFYAMKLVAGRPLRALISERTTVEERIGLLHHVIAVTDAIAYAHDRNVIHRDLKPGNVIVGEFGETIVIDWGLAKELTGADDNAPRAIAVGTPSPADHDGGLTGTGAVLGTPAYMAPEQARGEPVDRRADVFAIGAMLWELCALERVPPAERRLRHRILRRAGIGKDLITILDKALDPDPARRYPNAGALAADLKAFKSGARIAARRYSLPALVAHWLRRHRALALATAAAAAAGAVTLAVTVWFAGDAGPRCELAAGEIARVWNPEARQRITTAFQASTRPHAAATLVRVTGGLERRTTELGAARVGACEATHVRGEQSTATLDLRMACLERRLDGVRALVAVLGSGHDEEVIDRATSAVDALTGPQGCEAAAVASRPPPPDGARVQVEQAGHALADAKALFDAGKYDGAARSLSSLVERVRAIGYPPLIADVVTLQARALDAGGDAAAAIPAFRAAALAAAAAQDDGEVAVAWLGEVAALVDGDVKAAAVRLPFAEVAVARTGRTDQREEYLLVRSDVESAEAHHDLAVADLEQALASITRRGQGASAAAARIVSRLATALSWLGRDREAVERFQQSLAAITEVFGPDHPRVGAALQNLAVSLEYVGNYDQARELANRALSIEERTLGPTSPGLAYTLMLIGNIAAQQGRVAEATAADERALTIREVALGARHPMVARALAAVANDRRMAGRPDEAVELARRALAIREQTLGVDHPEVAESLEYLARVELARGQLGAAAVAVRRSVAIRERALGPDHRDVAESLEVLADVLERQHHEAEACAARARAVALLEKALAKDQPQLTTFLAAHAGCLVDAGAVALARSTAERAVAIGQRSGLAPADQGAAQFALARALWPTASDRPRAIAAAEAAQALYARAPPGDAREAEAVTRWLAAHKAPSSPH